MKKLLKKLGFESIFYAGLLLLIVLPAMVFARQREKPVTVIIIKNGDTLVNGRQLNSLKANDKENAVKACHQYDK